MKASEADNLMQLEFYKKRCEEMHKEHKQALVKMMPGYTPHADVAASAAAGEEGEGAALYEAEIMRLGKIVVENEQAMQAKKKESADVRRLSFILFFCNERRSCARCSLRRRRRRRKAPTQQRGWSSKTTKCGRSSRF
jgi:hypothetical protein